MSDLIDRQAAIDAMAELQGRASSKAELKGISKAWKMIKQLPPAQPERIKGRWISADAIFGGVPFYCSECGENTRDTVMGKPRWKFCPNCGAEMGVTT